MRERILAIVGAVALVAVAVALRAQLADDDTTGAERSGGGRPVVACTPDLMAVCDALVADGRIADDPPELDLGEEAATARAGDRRIDGWVTWDPAPGVANFEADELQVDRPWEGSSAVAASPIAVAVRVRDGSLGPDCAGGRPPWTCVADAARLDPPLAVGVGTGRTAESLARFQPVAATLAPEGDYLDLLQSDVRAVLDSPTQGQRSFAAQLDTLLTAPGALNLVVGPQAAMPQDARTGIWTPQPAAEMVVVLAWRTGGSGEGVADRFGSDRVEAALRDVGVAPGAGTLAPEGRAGELFQVRQKVG
ncbi:MAG TPA: hypothetical protein VHK88_14770 [Aquihabitans sp.]|nr:hypothetical protein [Aquihabitans sp.]